MAELTWDGVAELADAPSASEQSVEELEWAARVEVQAGLDLLAHMAYPSAFQVLVVEPTTFVSFDSTTFCFV